MNALRTGKVDALLNNAYAWSYELQRPSYSDLRACSAVMAAGAQGAVAPIAHLLAIGQPAGEP